MSRLGGTLRTRSARKVGALAALALAASVVVPSVLPAAPAAAVAVPTAAGSISAGAGFTTCGVSSAGAALCWGANADGQVGDGTRDRATTPTTVTGLSSGVVAVSSSEDHSCALTSAGGVKCWGFNSSAPPAQVSALTSGVTAITAGQGFSCALLDTGGVKCWGAGADGRLGNGSNSTSGTPVNVVGLTSGVVSISTDDRHTCAVTSAGAVKCWGDNFNGQLGNGVTTDSNVPVDVAGLGSGMASVGVGGSHSCAVSTAGALSCWGGNGFGQLGAGTTGQRVFAPTTVTGMASGVATVTAGYEHTCATTTGGALRCWGLNSDGRLGDGSFTSRSVPVDVLGMGSGVRAVAAGWNHTCALRSSGSLSCWGSNTWGQVGRPVTSVEPLPLPPSRTDLASIAVGTAHTCASTTAGAALCWGWNSYRQLGDGTGTERLTPTPVTGLDSGVASVAAGYLHSCARTTAGAALCWGRNSDGQLGTGTTSTGTVPTAVVGLDAGVSAITAGSDHSCAVVSGAARCWGIASRLGDGTATASTVPVAVTGLGSGVTGIAAGGAHTCAVTSTGAVWCWGSNASGQLGDGTTVSATSPVAVTGLPADVVAVAAGDSHSCALTGGGAVLCWGAGTAGELGDGASASSSTPVPVSGLGSGVASITAGYHQACAVTVGGAAKCWGSNLYRQLGSGVDTSSAAVPTDVSGLGTGVVMMGTRGGTRGPLFVGGFATDAPTLAHTCALTTAGAYTCWGSNSNGQTGTMPGDRVPKPVAGLFGPVAAAPSIVGSRSPAANAAGWNNEPVTVSFTCTTDALESCTAPVTVSANGADQSVAGTVTDTFGQSASTTVGGISVDQTPPTLSGVATTAPNAAGWYQAPVAMAWICDDALSGLAPGTCPASASTVGEGSSVSLSASVTDVAGNQTTASSESVQIDLTKPSTGVSSPPTWSSTDVTLTLSPTDALSGVASTSYRIDGGATESGTAPVVSGQGVHSVEFWSTDAAGNVESPQTVQVRIDVQAPSITASRSVPANGAGWNNGPVTVSFDCGDEPGGSGVASCSAPQAFTTEVDTTATGNATDGAGNTASVQVPVRIDLTAPTVTANVPAANANGWFNAAVQVPFTCSDTGGSGVATCPAPVVFGGEGADQPVTGDATDAAGNTGTASGASVSLDTTAPSISGAALQTANPGGGYFGDVTMRWTCGDALSGVATCPADVPVSGEGVHVVSRSVTDRAGNTSTAEVTIQIDHDPSTDPGTVHGAITDSGSGAVVAGASVTLRTTSNAIVATTTTATDGTYLFPAVADGTYKVYAAKNLAYQGSYRPGTFTVARGTSTTADHALAPTLSLSGTVRSTSGTPIAGATVRVAPSSLVAVTGADGRYQVNGLLPGPVTVKVLATGFVTPADAAVTINGAVVRDYSLEAAAPGGGVKGTITGQANGLPIRGATVRIWLKGATTYSQTVSTGTDGRYSIPSLAIGTYEIDAVAMDHQVRWFGNSLSRSGAAPVAITSGCTASPDPAWGDPCAFPASVALRR